MERFKKGDVIKWASCHYGSPPTYELIALVRERGLRHMKGVTLYDSRVGGREFFQEIYWSMADGYLDWPEEHYIRLSEGVADGES